MESVLERKRVLIITASFPPDNTVASLRLAGFSKYLAEDFDVHVLTAGQSGKSFIEEEFMVFENGKRASVVRIKNNDWLYYFLSLDRKSWAFPHKLKVALRRGLGLMGLSPYRSWAKEARKYLHDYMKRDKPDVVISSYSPIEPVSITYDVLSSCASRETLWVLDMRDEYSQSQGASFLEKWLRRREERKFSQRADLLISVSMPLVYQYKNSMKDLRSFMEVRNGFDHDLRFPAPLPRRKVQFGYFGSFYGQIKPYDIFEAILALNLQDQIELNIAVRNCNFKIPPELVETVKLLPYMEYEEAVKKMADMDCNILILPFDDRPGVYSGKLFDYISSGRSILAVVNTEDVAGKLVEKLGCGYLADYRSFEDIKRAVSKVVEDWNAGCLRTAAESEIEKMHRRKQVKKLSRWINGCADELV